MTSSLVFCVHGFMRTGVSMLPISLGLRRLGWRTRVVTQFNLHRTIPDLADGLFAQVEAARDADEAISGERPDAHFVTHSMGGIVVRSMLARHEVTGPNRVVMLAPPNQGSRLAEHANDRVLRLPWGGFDPLRKLLPGERGECAGAGDPDAEFGVIAGAPAPRSGWVMGNMDRLALAGQGEHDGKVAVDEARWDHAVDFIEVPYGHTFIMARPEVIQAASRFLRHARFSG